MTEFFSGILAFLMSVLGFTGKLAGQVAFSAVAAFWGALPLVVKIIIVVLLVYLALMFIWLIVRFFKWLFRPRNKNRFR